VARLVQDALAALRPDEAFDPTQLERTFTLRTSDGFVENFGPGLIQRLAVEAPLVRLRFLPKLTRDSALMRDGTVDLETGVIGEATGPEVIARALFRDRFVGVVR
jgi:DNA-binding transcriptional LysR family regulator